MTSEFKLYSTTEPEKLREIYTLCGSEWSGRLTQEQFGESEAHKFTLSEEYGMQPEGFYIADKKDGKVVASTVIKRVKGFYKETDRSISSVPDPATIGVKNATFLLVGYVFVAKEHRKKGLARVIVSKAMESTENQIINQHLEKSDKSKTDNFKNMVTSNGKFDRSLANYYLGKKYFWFLYSGAGRFYERFGFKAYPLEFYKIPISSLGEEEENLISNMLKGDESGVSVGKKLRLLHGSNVQDQDLISFILQGSELEIMTDLNKQLFHSDLGGTHKSSSSLTNMSDVLAMSKLGSFNELCSIQESAEKVTRDSHPPQRRKSSILHLTVPKIAIKPDKRNIELMYKSEEYTAKNESNSNDDIVKFTDIKGAIITNELSQKSYYIIWVVLMQQRFYILSLGELNFDLLGATAMPPTQDQGKRRRGSSFTGMNELGAFNFQDLSILINTACWVAKNRSLPDSKAVYVSATDLPSTVPSPVLHDFFLNYLPQKFENVYSAEDETAHPDLKVEFITNAANKLLVLPMIRKFGGTSPEFDLDWTYNSMCTWG